MGAIGDYSRERARPFVRRCIHHALRSARASPCAQSPGLSLDVLAALSALDDARLPRVIAVAPTECILTST